MFTLPGTLPAENSARLRTSTSCAPSFRRAGRRRRTSSDEPMRQAKKAITRPGTR
jgi:hypothetical protein